MTNVNTKPKEYELAKAFKRDIVKLAKNRPEVLVSSRYVEVCKAILNGDEIPEHYNDHALSGDMKGMRDCHIYNDLVLIYQVNDNVVSFMRLASHSEIFD